MSVLIAASQLLTATVRPAWRGWSTKARHRIGRRNGESQTASATAISRSTHQGTIAAWVAITGRLLDELH